MKSIKDIKVANKKVLLRTDFNVPLEKANIGGIFHVEDNRRIVACLPTIKYLLKQKAKIIIITHIGRPEGKPNPEFKLDGVALELQKLLGKVVIKSSDIIGSSSDSMIKNLKSGEIALLANLRFDPGEEKNDKKFASSLAKYGDIYVNDAFSVSHRAHASVSAITKLLPSYCGFLFEQELSSLEKIISGVKRPLYIVLGGAKPKEKIPVIENLLNTIDGVILGGLICSAFFEATNSSINNVNLTEIEKKNIRGLIKKIQEKNIKLILPQDVLVNLKGSGQKIIYKNFIDLKKNELVKDLGEESLKQIKLALEDAKSIFWNGTLGVVEESAFEYGTKELTEFLALRGKDTIVCGGDTLSAIDKFGLTEKFPKVSLGGGAALEFLSGKKLPGVVALK